jgi:hypothetical protein
MIDALIKVAILMFKDTDPTNAVQLLCEHFERQFHFEPTIVFDFFDDVCLSIEINQMFKPFLPALQEVCYVLLRYLMRYVTLGFVALR